MIINYSDKNIKKNGRTFEENDMLHFSQSCSGIEFNIKAKQVSVHIVTNSPDMEQIHKGYIGVVLDDNPDTFKKIPVFEREADYIIFKSENAQQHRISVFKVSENYMAYVAIKHITADDEAIILTKPNNCERLVEFIGDSITCGYGIESTDPEEKFTTEKENVYYTYAAQAARHFKMDMRFVSRSGIGIYSSWTDKQVPNRDLLMPEYYLLTDSYYDTLNPESKKHVWDFQKERKADLIVINLGSNDASWTNGHMEREELFYNAYVDFLSLIKKKNPTSKIICAYGAFESTLIDKVSAAVETVKKLAACEDIYTFTFTQHEDKDGYGCDHHPSQKSHNRMANELIEKIEKII